MKLWKILGVELYEVGDLYLTMNNKNPGLRFKGTWELIAQGRTLVGVDTSQTEFNAVKKIGGSKYLQKHNHPFNLVNGKQVTWAIQESTQISLNGSAYPGRPALGSSNADYDSHGYINMKSAGEGDTQNLQPYITCYIWERVS